MRKLILGAMLVALVMTAVGCKVVVTPTATNGWFFLNEPTKHSPRRDSPLKRSLPGRYPAPSRLRSGARATC